MSLSFPLLHSSQVQESQYFSSFFIPTFERLGCQRRRGKRSPRSSRSWEKGWIDPRHSSGMGHSRSSGIIAWYGYSRGCWSPVEFALASHYRCSSCSTRKYSVLAVCVRNLILPPLLHRNVYLKRRRRGCCSSQRKTQRFYKNSRTLKESWRKPWTKVTTWVTPLRGRNHTSLSTPLHSLSGRFAPRLSVQTETSVQTVYEAAALVSRCSWWGLLACSELAGQPSFSPYAWALKYKAPAL